MNKKANTFSVIMLSLILFMTGMIVVNFIMPEVTTARSSLSCSNAASISDGTKFMCLMVGSVVPYFFILIVSIAGGVIVEKLAV